MTGRVEMARSKMVALMAIFGAMAILFTQVWIPLFFGNPNLGSTPITIAAVLCPMPVGIASGIIKGLGASLWTGQPYIEIPAGIGDAMMAIFTKFLVRRWRKRVYAAVVGQLSRYLFTSGMIALYIGLAVSLGSSGPEAIAFQSLRRRYPLAGGPPYSPSPFIANFIIVWVGIFPAVTLSILANALISTMIISLAGERIEGLLKVGKV